MKKLLIIFAVLLVLVGGVFGFALLNINSFAQRYKPDLEKIATTAIGAPVTFGSLEVGVFPSPKLIIKNFEIGGTSSNEANGVSFNEFALYIKLLPLLKGGLEIDELALEKPVLSALLTKDGLVIPGLTKKSTPPPTQGAAKNSSAKSEETTQAPAAEIPAWFSAQLKKIRIVDGSVTIDDTVKGTTYTAEKIALKSGIAFATNTVVLSETKLSALLLKKIEFLTTTPQLSYSIKEQQVDLRELTTSVDGKSGSIAQITTAIRYSLATKSGEVNIKSPQSIINLGGLAALSDIIPALQQLALTGKVAPGVKITLGNGGFESAGAISFADVGATKGEIVVSKLRGTVTAKTNQTIKQLDSTGLDLLIGNEPVKIAFGASLENDTQAKLRSLTIDGFGGKVQTAASAELLKAKSFVFNMNAQNIKLKQLIAAVKPELAPTIEGDLSQFELKTQGSLGETLKSSLLGAGSIVMRNCTLKGVNVAGEVLRSIKGLPFLKGSLLDSIPENERRALESPDTSLQSLSASFKIGNEQLTTPDLNLVSALFALAADGSVGFNKDLDLNSTIYFSAEFSNNLVQRTKELKYALDSQNRLVIPLTLKGVPPKVVILPNVKKLGEVAGRKALEEGASKLLDDVLSGKKSGNGKKGLGGLLGF